MMQLYSILESTDEEKKKRYWQSIEQRGTPLKLVYDHAKTTSKKIPLRPANNEPSHRQRLSNDARNPETQTRADPHMHQTDGGPSTQHDPMFSFTWPQYQAFVHEIGDYAARQVMS